MAAPSNNRVWLILIVLAIFAGTAWRAAHLDDRPLHADEAVQAWQTHQLLSGEGYRYDPFDRHGPTLYYGAAALHRLRGGSAADFDDRSARRFSLAIGIATFVLIGWGSRTAGFPMATGALAVSLLAFETLSSVYHTYFVQEATLAFLLWGFIFLALNGSNQRPLIKALFMGGIMGLAQASKEITPIYIGLAIGALFLTRKESKWRPTLNQLIAVGLGFIVPYLVLYSSFGAHPAGIVDGVKHYFLQIGRLSESPHSYPWWHHLKTLGILKTGGPNWGQYILLALALAGGASALRSEAKRAHRVTAIFTFALLVFHSVVSYKTPWLLLTPMLGLVILAAEFLVLVGRRSQAGLYIAGVLALLAISQSYAKSSLALDRYPGDVRNPYFYEQAPRSLSKLPERIALLQSKQTEPLKVAVISPEHAWPLPWYLRSEKAIGFFAEAPEALSKWDVVIWDDQLGEVPPELEEFPIAEFYGLRPSVMLYTFVQGPIWEAAFPPLPAHSP